MAQEPVSVGTTITAAAISTKLERPPDQHHRTPWARRLHDRSWSAPLRVLDVWLPFSALSAGPGPSRENGLWRRPDRYQSAAALVFVQQDWTAPTPIFSRVYDQIKDRLEGAQSLPQSQLPDRR